MATSKDKWKRKASHIAVEEDVRHELSPLGRNLLEQFAAGTSVATKYFRTLYVFNFFL